MSTLRRFGLVLLLLGCMGATLLRAQVSLSTVVDMAQRNSSEVRIAEANVRKAEAQLAQTRDPMLPSMVINSGLPAFPSVGFMGGVPSVGTVEFQAMVWSLPQKQYIGAASAGLKAANLSLKEAKETSALEAASAYIELETVNRDWSAALEEEAFAARLVKIEEERSEAGVDPLSELLQAQLTAAQLKLKRIHLETRKTTLTKQIALMTGLPVATLTPDAATIPEVPHISGDLEARKTAGVHAAWLAAVAKRKSAVGDTMSVFMPQLVFNMEYLRSTKLWNNANDYYSSKLPIQNFASGVSISIPFFDWSRRDKARESKADALKAKAEAEQAQRQTELQVASISASLRELDTVAEIAALKQQIAQEQIKTVQTQLENAVGTQQQITPKAEQLARIDEREKFQESLDAALELSKARLQLLHALGHMEDWLRTLQAK